MRIISIVVLALLAGCEGGVTGEAVEHSIESCQTRGGIEKLIRVKQGKVISYKVVCKDGTAINVLDHD